jgi:excinuclease ABC subunit B
MGGPPSREWAVFRQSACFVAQQLITYYAMLPMMDKKLFKLHSPFKPTGDQPRAIKKLTKGLKDGLKYQTLLGVTGSGKTFVAANVIQNLQRPALILSHNKTLAAQLASEFQEFFPENAVHYFVSYYDYYQPEAYVPRTDTYIQKDADINDEIDRLRHAATQALLTRRDVIIVASVSCIYGIGSPEEYLKEVVKITKGQKIQRNDLLKQLTHSLYERNDIDFKRGTFRVHGDTVDIHPVGDDMVIRISFFGETVERITRQDPLTGEILQTMEKTEIFPAKLYLLEKEKQKVAVQAIRAELVERALELRERGKIVEAQRLEQRTNYDLEMIETVGYVSGIENFSRHLDGRKPGDPPGVLLDYFPKDFLAFVDESHMTLPQVSGMYAGDRARKETLIAHGFRLPSALDNRPLRFDEFEKRLGQTVYVSATPAKIEKEKSQQTVELIVRPTGLIDPRIEIHPTEHQIDHLLEALKERIKKGERVIVTTLTKRMAEDLSGYLQDLNIKVQYLHSDIDTLERVEILRDLRLGKYDVLVGINLLREGLDLPEVSLVAILDADKEGYLRSDAALIQVMGRAARHINGHVLMYADKITGSMQRAIDETTRRRTIQEKYNIKNKITPKTIVKSVREDRLAGKKEEMAVTAARELHVQPEDVPHILKELTAKMHLAAENLDFEEATKLRDMIKLLKGEKSSVKKRWRKK